MHLPKIGLVTLLMALSLLACDRKVPEKHVQADSDPGVVREQPAALAAEQAPQKEFQFGPAVSVLEGTLHQVTFFGPPTYGENPETDAQEQGFVLKLRKPIDVQGDAAGSNAAVQGITEIQLITQDPKLAKYKGLKVRVTGPLSAAKTDHDHMPILMHVQQFREM